MYYCVALRLYSEISEQYNNMEWVVVSKLLTGNVPNTRMRPITVVNHDWFVQTEIHQCFFRSMTRTRYITEIRAMVRYMKSASPELFLLNSNDCTSKETISLRQSCINNIRAALVCSARLHIASETGHLRDWLLWLRLQRRKWCVLVVLAE